MPKTTQNTQFGRFVPPEDRWLALAEIEPVLEPELPIIDAHHHLWHRHAAGAGGSGEHRYMLNEVLADLNSGLNVIASVFVEDSLTGNMARADGPKRFRPLGEVEFANGIAAMSASGNYGPTKVAAGIVGFVDLTLGVEVGPVLEAMIAACGGRFRGVRGSGNWDADPIIGNGKGATPDLFHSPTYEAGFRKLIDLNLSFDAWVFHPQIGEVTRLAQRLPEANIILGHMGGILGYGPYANRKDEVYRSWHRKACGWPLLRGGPTAWSRSPIRLRRAVWRVRPSRSPTSPCPRGRPKWLARWLPRWARSTS